MRLIDADELIEHAWRDKLDSRELIAEMIKKAPTIKEISIKIPIDVYEKLISQEPRWISVSERLPENKETVIVTFKHFVSGNTIGLGSVILLRDKPHWHVREQNLGTYDVLAWMPLPKPYKAESEE